MRGVVMWDIVSPAFINPGGFTLARTALKIPLEGKSWAGDVWSKYDFDNKDDDSENGN